MPFLGGGGGGGSTTTTTSGPPPQVLANYQGLVNATNAQAQAPLQLYGGPMVAGFTPQQQQAFQTIGNAQGIGTPYINAAAQEYGLATTPLWQTLPQLDTASIGSAGLQGIAAAQTTAQNLPGSVSPYTGFSQGQAGNVAATAAGIPASLTPATNFATGQAGTAAGQAGTVAGVAGGVQSGVQPSTGFAQGQANQIAGTAAGIPGSLQPYQQAGTTYNIDPYFSPYTQQVTQATQALFNQQNAQQLEQVRGNATSQGAYGGDREAVAEALTAQQQQLAEAPTLANIQQQGFQAQQQEANQQQQLQLQAGQLGLGGQQAAIAGGAQAGQLGLGAGQLGLGAAQTAGQLGLGAGQLNLGAGQLGLGGGQLTLGGQQAAIQGGLGAGQLGLGGGQLTLGANTAGGQLGLAAGQGLMGEFNTQQQQQLAAEQGNAWLASQAGFGLGALGTEAQSLALGGAQAELGAGGLQQQLAQEQMNIPYQQFVQTQAYPYQQIGFAAPIIEGTGSLSGGTGSTTQPGPSALSQIGGLASAGAGLAGLYNQYNNSNSGALQEGAAANDVTGGGSDFGGGGDYPTANRGGRIRYQIGGTLPEVPGISSGVQLPNDSYIPQKAAGATPSSVISPFKDVTTTSGGGGGGGSNVAGDVIGGVNAAVGVGKLALALGFLKEGGRAHRQYGGSTIGDQTSGDASSTSAQTPGTVSIGSDPTSQTPTSPYGHLPKVPRISLDDIVGTGPQVKHAGLGGSGPMGAGPPKPPTPAGPAQGFGTPQQGQDISNAAKQIGQLFKSKDESSSSSDSGAGPNDSSGGGGDDYGGGHDAIGGRIGRYQSGGASTTPLTAAIAYGGAPPVEKQQYAQLAEMTPERLFELRAQYGTTSPTGQLIQKVLTQKQATPGSGTAPLAGVNTAPSLQQLNTYAGLGGGQGQQSGQQPQGGTSQMATAKEGGVAGAGWVTPDELDPHPVVDHSGDTVKVHYPSEGKVLDLGLPPIRSGRQGYAAGGSAGPYGLNTTVTPGIGSASIQGPNPAVGQWGTQAEAAPGTASNFIVDSPTAAGVPIPQLAAGMFSPPGNVQPGGGIGNWFQPMAQYRPPGMGPTGPGGSMVFPSTTAYEPQMGADIAAAFGSGATIPAWASPNPGPSAAAPPAGTPSPATVGAAADAAAAAPPPTPANDFGQFGGFPTLADFQASQGSSSSKFGGRAHYQEGGDTDAATADVPQDKGATADIPPPSRDRGAEADIPVDRGAEADIPPRKLAIGDAVSRNTLDTLAEHEGVKPVDLDIGYGVPAGQKPTGAFGVSPTAKTIGGHRAPSIPADAGEFANPRTRMDLVPPEQPAREAVNPPTRMDLVPPEPSGEPSQSFIGFGVPAGQKPTGLFGVSPTAKAIGHGPPEEFVNPPTSLDLAPTGDNTMSLEQMKTRGFFGGERPDMREGVVNPPLQMDMVPQDKVYTADIRRDKGATADIVPRDKGAYANIPLDIQSDYGAAGLEPYNPKAFIGMRPRALSTGPRTTIPEPPQVPEWLKTAYYVARGMPPGPAHETTPTTFSSPRAPIYYQSGTGDYATTVAAAQARERAEADKTAQAKADEAYAKAHPDAPQRYGGLTSGTFIGDYDPATGQYRQQTPEQRATKALEAGTPQAPGGTRMTTPDELTGAQTDVAKAVQLPPTPQRHLPARSNVPPAAPQTPAGNVPQAPAAPTLPVYNETRPGETVRNGIIYTGAGNAVGRAGPGVPDTPRLTEPLAGAAPPGPVWVTGASQGWGLIRHGGLQGTTSDRPNVPDVDASIGRSPQTELEYIRAKAQQGYWRGKNVLLDTGLQNDPSQVNAVAAQYQALKDAGANVIGINGFTAVGAKGTDMRPYADQVSKFAQEKGIPFGGIFTEDVRPHDPVHLTAAGYNKVSDYWSSYGGGGQAQGVGGGAGGAQQAGGLPPQDRVVRPPAGAQAQPIPNAPGGAAPQGGGAGPQGNTQGAQNARTVITTARSLGASNAAIVGLLTNTLYEGGLNDPWLKAGRGEQSWGPWQFNQGGELPGYMRFLQQNNLPNDVASQTRFLLARMEQIHPGFSQIQDARQAVDIVHNEFEKPAVQGNGLRYGRIADATAMLNGTYTGNYGPSGGGGYAGLTGRHRMGEGAFERGGAGGGAGPNPNAPDANSPEGRAVAQRVGQSMLQHANPEDRSAIQRWMNSPSYMLFLIGAGMLASRSPFPGVALGEGLQFAAKGLQTQEGQEYKNQMAELRAQQQNITADYKMQRAADLRQNAIEKMQTAQDNLTFKYNNMSRLEQQSEAGLALRQQVADQNAVIAAAKLDLQKTQNDRLYEIRRQLANKPPAQLALLQAVMNDPNNPNPPKNLEEAQQRLHQMSSNQLEIHIQQIADYRAHLEQQAFNADSANAGRSFDVQAATNKYANDLRAELAGGGGRATAAPPTTQAQQPTTATGPNNQKLYSPDGGHSWFTDPAFHAPYQAQAASP